MNFHGLPLRVKITTFTATPQEKNYNLPIKFQKEEENVPNPFR